MSLTPSLTLSLYTNPAAMKPTIPPVPLLRPPRRQAHHLAHYGTKLATQPTMLPSLSLNLPQCQSRHSTHHVVGLTPTQTYHIADPCLPAHATINPMRPFTSLSLSLSRLRHRTQELNLQSQVESLLWTQGGSRHLVFAMV